MNSRSRTTHGRGIPYPVDGLHDLVWGGFPARKGLFAPPVRHDWPEGVGGRKKVLLIRAKPELEGGVSKIQVVGNAEGKATISGVKAAVSTWQNFGVELRWQEHMVGWLVGNNKCPG